MKDFFLLAYNNLKHRGVRSWLTLIGIFIGITAVVALISLGEGLSLAVNSQFGISSTEIISVQAGGVSAFGPPGSGDATPLTMDDLEEIERISSVERVIRRNVPPAKLEFNDRAIFGFTINIPDGNDRKFAYDIFELKAEQGRLLKDGDDNKVFLGYNFLSNDVGLEKEVRVGNKVTVQGKDFEVIGIAEKKGSFIFDNIVYMNEEPMEELFKYGEEVDVIGVQVKDADEIERTKEEIEKALRKSRDVKVGEEDFEVSTPQASLDTVNSVLAGVTAFIAIVASLSILVGAIGIVNTMTTSVLERRKEIGIMKSIGATNEQIFLQFFIESGLLGLVGGIVGVIIGISIGFIGTVAIGVFIGAEITPKINYVLIVISLIASFLIGAISGIVPAIGAAKENPVEALRV